MSSPGRYPWAVDAQGIAHWPSAKGKTRCGKEMKYMDRSYSADMSLDCAACQDVVAAGLKPGQERDDLGVVVIAYHKAGAA